jgi:hypothetical protein
MARRGMDLRHLPVGVAPNRPRQSVYVPGWLGVSTFVPGKRVCPLWTPEYEGQYVAVLWDTMLALSMRLDRAACDSPEEAVSAGARRRLAPWVDARLQGRAAGMRALARCNPTPTLPLHNPRSRTDSLTRVHSHAPLLHAARAGSCVRPLRLSLLRP